MSSSDRDEKDEKNNNDDNDDDGGGEIEGGACSCCDVYALKVNDYIEKAFCAVGWIIGGWPYFILGLVLLFLVLCCFGYIFLTTETNIFNLWTPTNSPVFDEKEFIDFYWGDKDYGLLIISGYAKEGEHTDILSDKYLQEWHQIHIDLATKLPKKEYEYTALDNSQKTVTFGYFAENYHEPKGLIALEKAAQLGEGPSNYASEIIPICRPVSQSPAEAQFIMPCYMLSVIDCFSEGGYFFPWENYLSFTQLSSLIPANLFTYDRDSFVGLKKLQIGERLARSCSGFTGVTPPPNLIYGGEERMDPSNESSTILSLKSYQIAMYTDSPINIARKVKIAAGKCKYTPTYGLSCPEITENEKEEAQQFVDDWLLDYIDFMQDYAKKLSDDDSKLFELVYWTPRTTRDLLREASAADFGLLAIAYIAMIIFASLTAINVNDWFLSRSEASFAGVLLVLFAVISTIGLGSFLQIPLSPNILQVLPFIALGFGVDDMFVLLFSFKFREHLSVQEMISETTRIAGSSVALTSLANFFGFLIGTTMVLPDVARFATYGAIIVLLNFIAIVFGFTSVLTLVARRMKNEYNDWSFIFCFATFTRATTSKITSEKPSSIDISIFDPLFDWLTKTYTRVVMLIAFVALIIAGLVGCSLIQPGLPLADIVPLNSYASDFLRIREKFYFSYPVSLYTDVQGADEKPIDWENKFEDWINATNDIYSISDNVYKDPVVHSFWAWGLKKYLQGRYIENNYEFGEAFDIAQELADDPVYQPYMCQNDADMYCNTLPRDYLDRNPVSGDLFNCLLVNYQLGNLESDCGEWVKQMYIATVDTALAKQIYITSFDDESVNGLYVRPSSNDIKVFIKQPNEDAYIYQTNCGQDACEWRLLDADFNILYIGEATSIDSDAPTQGGWRDGLEGKTPVAITHVYYDFGVSFYAKLRDKSKFMAGDYSADSIFSFSYMYKASDASNDGSSGCVEYEVMRLLMSDSDAYKEVSFSSDIGDNDEYDTICNAVLESSEVCVAIRDELNIGSVYCGSSETAANKNLWYLSDTSDDGLYQIMSSPNNNGNRQILSVPEETFNNCENPSLWKDNSNFTYNYLKPCGGTDDFGGFGVSEINNQSCNMEDQTIDLQCTAFATCTDLKACYNDYRRIASSIPGSDCQPVDIYDKNVRLGQDEFKLSNIVAECSFKYYDTLSDCCRTAVDASITALPQYTCSFIESKFDPKANFSNSLKTVCKSTDKCQYDEEANTCTEVSNGNVFDDCRELIIGPNAVCSLAQVNMTKADVRTGDQEHFYDCMFDAVKVSFAGTRNRIRKSGSDDCQNTFNTQSAIYADCLYPVDSFYDLITQSYDYSMCSDADIEAIETNSGNMTCGDSNTDTDTQLECLQDNIEFVNDGCCKLAIEQITSDGTFSFTNECEADVDFYCAQLAPYGLTSAGEALLAALNDVQVTLPDGTTVKPGELCLTAIATAAADAKLSPKCLAAMTYCEANGGFETSKAGENATLPCSTGYSGQQTRTCMVDVPLVKWGDVDISNCVALTCGEIVQDANDASTYNQYWPETEVGSIYRIQGGSINSDGSDGFTMTQVSSVLQRKYIDGGGTACNPQTGNQIWYARRACMLNPYNTSKAQWQEPIVECKPFVTYWNNIHEQTICDFITEQVTAKLASNVDAFGFVNTLKSIKKANLVDAIPWVMVDGAPTDAKTQIELSQTYCSLQVDNCAAFTYDNQLQISYFFDYCPILSSSDMAGIIPEIVNSPAYVGGPLDTVAHYATLEARALYPNITLTKDTFTAWAYYPDIIIEEFAPDMFTVLQPKLNTFADRHTTYIAPLNQVEFIASYCSLRTAKQASIAEDPMEAELLFISPMETWNSNGIPEAECFNNTLWLFFIDPTGNGVVKRDSMYFVDDTQAGNLTGFDNVQIVTTSNSMIIKDINDDRVAVEFIQDLRSRLNKWANEDELYVIPGGLIIDLFSQYIDVETHLINNLLWVCIAIFCCGIIFLLNPIAVIVALLCNAAMVIEVYGFSDWFGLRINGVLVLNITIAVALTMEFTAHIGRAFVLTYVTEKDRKVSIALPFSNDGQIRMKKTLREMFTPVSLGALTTLIGVAPIAAAQFPYFRQYYFTLYVLIVLFGWLNGVIFQVVILSFIPPKPFVYFASSNVHVSNDSNQQSSNPLVQPLVQHQELQQGTNNTNNKQEDGNVTINTKGGPLETSNAKQEIIQSKHTRDTMDAP